jgi:PAS domain S-box-containing protein
VNNAVTELIGYTSVDFTGMAMSDFTAKLNLNYLDLLHELDLLSTAKQHIPVRDVVIMTKSQTSVDVEMRLETIANNQDGELSYLMVMSNIATRKKLENELHQFAYYDKLTDLPNRRMFMDALHNTIKSSQYNKK